MKNTTLAKNRVTKDLTMVVRRTYLFFVEPFREPRPPCECEAKLRDSIMPYGKRRILPATAVRPGPQTSVIAQLSPPTGRHHCSTTSASSAEKRSPCQTGTHVPMRLPAVLAECMVIFRDHVKKDMAWVQRCATSQRRSIQSAVPNPDIDPATTIIATMGNRTGFMTNGHHHHHD